MQNAIDSSHLQRTIAGLDPRAVARFSDELDLRGRTALFIGGLDDSKRIPFLLESARLISASDPDFRLVIIGSGSGAADVGKDRLEHYVSYLGSKFGDEKAIAMAACDVLAMPGRVGLVAVDSFAAALPIVTTAWAWHAPEFEYLEDGTNALITADDIEAYAAGLGALLSDDRMLEKLRAGARKSAEIYTVGRMVENMIDGVQRTLIYDDGVS